MSNDKQLLKDLYKSTEIKEDVLNNPEIAHLFVHHNKVLGARLVPGLEVITEEMKDGVKVDITLKKGTDIKQFPFV